MRLSPHSAPIRQTFGTSAGGWSSDDTYPRELADVNGDGRADIIGFSSAGVYESLATAGGQFAAPTFELAAFCVDAGGWSSDNTYPRALADVNGDGRADIIAFSSAGVYESLATAGGHFAMPTFELAAFGTDAGSWSSDNTYPREVADVNGDGRADIIAFSSVGVYESLATAGGHFAAPTFELAAFGTDAGGWSSDNTYPRFVADVNGDGMADIVGFAQSGVYVSLATGGGHLAAPTFELAAFGVNAGGWTSDDLYPRTLADVNGDGMADIVGFGADGAFTALATGGGQFASPTFQLSALSPNAGGWSSNNTYPRELADVNGDHVADILGFASNGVWGTTTQVGPPTTTTEFPLPTPGASPFSIALGSDGNVWFTEVNGNKIGKITPDGAITEFPWHGLPGGMTAGPDGALWFTEIGDNKIGSITTGAIRHRVHNPDRRRLCSSDYHRAGWRAVVCGGWSRQDRAGDHRGPVQRVLYPHSGRRTFRYRSGPRRQCVVHRNPFQQDRPDHDDARPHDHGIHRRRSSLHDHGRARRQ